MANNKSLFVLICFFFLIFSTSCNEYTPKPSAYPRIDRSEVDSVKNEGKEFSFYYSGDARLESLVSEQESEIWFNLVYPQFDAKIYCTYIPITKNKLPEVLEDSYQLAYSHASVADGILQTQYVNEDKHITGLIYDIKGSVAVPLQFYVTDNARNFLRGSLYFNKNVEKDSIAPIVSFLRDDIEMLMETIEWKNPVK
ncbi:MAG: hypothetical protein E6767_15610 [Dysgonomonas sp.]|nr:hypothetical protein [Dysgonomonas sp.]